ncbi:MAG TPA: DUF1236 domain-containing protein [Methylocella sp.]
MRTSLLTTIAGAALIAGGSLAMAQRMESSPANGARGSSQRELSGSQNNASEREPGAMQGQTRGRSGAVEEKEQRSEHPGAMQGQTMGRSGAVEEKEQRSEHRGAMQGQTQGRSGAVEENGQRSERHGAMQDQTQGRSGRSVGSVGLSSVQKTKIHDTIIGGNFHRVDHVDFPISVGTRVPDTVTFYDIPETIVEIVPQYRGLRYIVVEDQLVIIDPDTLDIVAVLPA